MKKLVFAVWQLLFFSFINKLVNLISTYAAPKLILLLCIKKTCRLLIKHQNAYWQKKKKINKSKNLQLKLGGKFGERVAYISILFFELFFMGLLAGFRVVT